MAALKKEHMVYIAVTVIIIVAVAAYLSLNYGGCTECGKQVSSSQLTEMQAIADNVSTASKVGVGIVSMSGPNSNLPKQINDSPLIISGKPGVIYVGGDFCPFCAVTRWSLILALMRFGNFTSLSYMRSSSSDSFANTATFSFDNYTYRSSIIGLSATEIFNRQGGNNTAADFTPMQRYLYGRYGTGIPFIDFGNRSIQSGAVISPQLLSGYDWQQIIANMSNPNTPVAQGVIGGANIFTAYICMSNATINSTASVCKEGYVKSIESQVS